MKRLGIIAGLLLLLAGVLALYLLALSQLRAGQDSEEDETALTSPVIDGAALSGGEGIPNPYLGRWELSAYDPAPLIPDFSLPATHGEDFRLSDYRGRFLLVYFGFLTCPDVCPTTLADLSRVMQELGALANEVQVVFITVDPERDSLLTLARYLAAFDENFIGLRGEEAALLPLKEQFGVTAVRRPVESSLGYTVDHTTSVFVLNPEGYLVGRIPYGTERASVAEQVEAVIQAELD
jgi:protein SCO1/2